jgi:hypothetical protein
MPWNDTAQIDFLNPEAREAVMQTIIGVCKQFPIVRFDAAMTLAKKHIQRLWYPEPGRGGDIASRGEHAISTEEFNRRIPNEFWREVVDRCALEAPNTLLLAEAFWMMEGYFVRTLGMHRVYNSAFMNMLKKEENDKYRQTIKNTLTFEPEILKRFVNFMNNPDEETAVAQFGKDDKYFGICTLMITQPGLPMFGHGQIEGFEEKYGMEYRKAYRDEVPDSSFVARHEREIFPLMKRRMLFSGSENFYLFDFYTAGGSVNENVYAYTNALFDERTLVLYNNFWEQTAGWVFQSAVAVPQKFGPKKQPPLAAALALHNYDTYFTALHEQRSSLWYLRSSKELHEKGMYFALGGYQAQVYLDIHELEDVNFNTWARLCAELNGRGVPDLHAALDDTLLGELYWKLERLFPPIIIEDNAKLKKEKAVKKESDTFGERLADFVAVFRKFLADPKLYTVFPKYGKHKEVPVKTIVANFEANLEKLQKEKSNAQSPITLAFATFTLFKDILGEGACGNGAVLLAEHYHLDRKLKELLAKHGVEASQAGRLVELSKAVIRRQFIEAAEAKSEKPKAKSKAAPKQKAAFAAAPAIPKTPFDLILQNYEAADFRSSIGVNIYDGTIWFNKELFDETLEYAAKFAALTAPAEKIKAFTAALHKAETKSAYKLDELLSELGK